MEQTFNTQREARDFIVANGIKYDAGRGGEGYHMICGFRKDGVSTYKIVPIKANDECGTVFSPKAVDKVPGATRKMSLTDRAVQARIKGLSKEQAIEMMISFGATKESARCTAHFVFVSNTLSKKHREMIEAGKWIGFNAR